MSIILNDEWKFLLQNELQKEYFLSLQKFLEKERNNYQIFPEEKNIFFAYNITPFEKIKVVILGQDPYHNLNQAHGLAFSVQGDTKLPPSLKNIFTELCNDEMCSYPKNGDLTPWAKQGVFLINTVLSVQAHTPNSHKNKGWEIFTNATIELINQKLNNVVFILWGKPAQEKIKLIDQSKHHIITSPHPSPLSAYRGFFDSKPFSKTNKYLKENNKQTIQWCL